MASVGNSSRKMVVVGDSGVGKTSMLAFRATGLPGTSWAPQIYWAHDEEMVFGHQSITLGFWDTAGGEEHDPLRPLSYPHAAVVLICFAVDNPASFENVTRRWLPEILHFCSSPKVPLLLVGCKADTRTQAAATAARGGLVPAKSERGGFVTYEQGVAIAGAIGATAYLECSSLTGEGVQEVIRSAGRMAASWDPNDPRPYQRHCRIF